VYNYHIHQQVNTCLQNNSIRIAGGDNMFYTRFVANTDSIHDLYLELYESHPGAAIYFEQLIQTIVDGYKRRPMAFKQRDEEKLEHGHWFLSNEITGMSLYVDRFSKDLKGLSTKLDYLKRLGVNLLHLMPIFKSPENESDGGYAVSDFRELDERIGTIGDLQSLRQKMGEEKMYLMLDIVLNHTSRQHTWAIKAKQGDREYQKFYYMFDDRIIPDAYDRHMPEIFPESSPGNFTFVEECKKWVMTVFHDYQWDLNYRNPLVFIRMLDTIFYYANLGVDILRIDAPAFIWKEPGTSCQNLPQAHLLLRLIKQCVQVATPGMALLAEAIVAPSAIMKYFGNGMFLARECDLAYNATQMALQWDALATKDTRVMLAAQHEILQKPFGTSWITYTRCHDDIGLGYEDYMIQQAGFDPFQHRKFLQDYYSGNYPASDAIGALFSVNPKTQDARISGSLASLCGLEKGCKENNPHKIQMAIRKILLMQAQSLFLGGIPMLFYGDEVGYTNDYSYLHDPGKYYDNRWMHRPLIDWSKNRKADLEGTVEEHIFSGMRKLIWLRKNLSVVRDYKNLVWLTPHNHHVAGYLRTADQKKLYCLFNFNEERSNLTWLTFKEHGTAPDRLYDYWENKFHLVGPDHEFLHMEPYSFLILEPK
jgi:amylosucrase